jgi:hypothetical protein
MDQRRPPGSEGLSEAQLAASCLRAEFDVVEHRQTPIITREPGSRVMKTAYVVSASMFVILIAVSLWVGIAGMHAAKTATGNTVTIGRGK